MDKTSFVKWIYPEAMKIGEINPVFVTAQAALESGWGSAAIGNNLFGITRGTTWKGKTKLVLTTEYFRIPSIKFVLPEKIVNIKKESESKYKYKVYRLFRDYDDIKDCLADHLSILKKPMYADAWPYRNNPNLYVEHIVDSIGAKYATAPNYVSLLKSIIKTVEQEIKSL